MFDSGEDFDLWNDVREDHLHAQNVTHGVCCDCQRVGRVKWDRQLRMYVMDSHSPFGPECEGVNTVPQALCA